MLFASYIRRQHVKLMVRLILLFNICCSLRIILMCCYKRYWYVFSNLNKPLRTESSGAIKVIIGAITLMLCGAIHFNGNVTGNLHLLRWSGVKSDGAVKLMYRDYKVKQCDLAVCYQLPYMATDCNLSLIVFIRGTVWFSMRYVAGTKFDAPIKLIFIGINVEQCYLAVC